MDATLNVRMGASLKERGDKVLHDHGVSASVAVRALWHELATTRALPPFLSAAVHDDEAKAKKMLALETFSGIARGTLSDLSDDQLGEIGAQRYE